MTKNAKNTKSESKKSTKAEKKAPVATPEQTGKKRGRPAMTPEQKAEAAAFRKLHPKTPVAKSVKGTKPLANLIAKLGDGLAVAISGLPEATIDIVKNAVKAGHDLHKETQKKLEAAKLVAEVALAEKKADDAKKAEKKAAKILALEKKLNDLKSKAGILPVAETDETTVTTPETAQASAPVPPATAASDATPAASESTATNA